jgi:hypothetical protein
MKTVKLRIALCIATALSVASPVLAQDALRGLAPADEYFGRFNLSILGVANTIRDAGNRLDAGADPREMIAGPLYFATDALHDWEKTYPSDPWIPKELLALEGAYLHANTDDGAKLAAQTEAWLVADYPNSAYAAQGRGQLAAASNAAPPAGIPSYASAWERFAALRAPLAPRDP